MQIPLRKFRYGVLILLPALLVGWVAWQQISINGADGASVPPYGFGSEIVYAIDSVKDWPESADDIESIEGLSLEDCGYGTSGLLAEELDKAALIDFVQSFHRRSDRPTAKMDIWDEWMSSGGSRLVEYANVRQWWASKSDLDFTLDAVNALILSQLLAKEEETSAEFAR